LSFSHLGCENVNNHVKIKEKGVKILGIDPGSRYLGFAIIQLKTSKIELLDAGVLRFKPSPLKFQLLQMEEGLNEVLEGLEIDEVAMENIFFAHNPKSILKLAQFRGAILFYLLKRFKDVSEYSPVEIKKALTGKGQASKEQVAFMVKKILGIRGEIKPFDITDAIAVAITHSQRREKV